MRTNDVILRTTTTLIAFILLAFSVYLFLAGHNAPGGGFIGGLMTAAAIILMYMTYGFESVKKIIPINFRYIVPIGLLIAVLSGAGALLFGEPFLSQGFTHLKGVPIFGELHLATAVLFDIGVYVTVVGITLTIILSIANDQ